MGWSFHRSVKLGPLRVNFSGSGVGVSAGLRGARVSVGPRGTYVSLGRGGFRYRAKLDNHPVTSPNYGSQYQGAAQQSLPNPYPNALAPAGHGYVYSAAVESLALASPDTTLADVQRRLNYRSWFQLYAVFAGGFLLLCLVALPWWATAFLGFGAIAAGIPIFLWDRERRTARILYDVDDPALLERMAFCNAAAEWLAHSSRLWHVYYSVATKDWKTNAGASTLIQRSPTRAIPAALPGLELNIGVYSVPFGPQHLVFLPDRLLIRQGTLFAAIPYEHLDVQGTPTRFIEDAAPPPDSRVVDTTWRFVNKSGGPDLRFNNNRQLPICLYGELVLSSASGLRVVLQTSNPESAARAANLLEQLKARASGAAAPQSAAYSTTAAPEQPTPYWAPHPAVPEAAAPAEQPNPVHRAVATLLRFVAVADRRLAEEEVAGAVAFLSELGVTDLGESGNLEEQFRALRSDDETAAQAASLVSGRAAYLVPYVIRAANEMAVADGKVTPKEQERLDWLRATMARPS